MRVLIMAGGAGTRLGRGEKPLVSICGQPMLKYVLDAFSCAGCEPVVVLSPKTPMTSNWCRAHGFSVVRGCGKGYIEDMRKAVHDLEDEEPLFISVSDIPCINAGLIRRIIAAYAHCGSDALSVWVPSRLVRSSRESMPYREIIHGEEVCPAGINILRGDLIDRVQEEYRFLADDVPLALNVNTQSELEQAESFLKLSSSGCSGNSV